jgi:hypothetical protein
MKTEEDRSRQIKTKNKQRQKTDEDRWRQKTNGDKWRYMKIDGDRWRQKKQILPKKYEISENVIWDHIYYISQ